MRVYVDASVVLRWLFSDEAAPLHLPDDAAGYSSIVVEIEVFRALDRARLGRRLDDAQLGRKLRQAAEELSLLRLMPVTRETIDRARTPFPLAVRALDALHVATAEIVRADAGEVEFWTHDARQANAARSRALDVRGDDA